MSDYREIARAMQDLDIALEASEAHGVLVGLVCAMAVTRAKTQWFAELLDTGELTAELMQKNAGALHLLDDLFESSVSGLNAADLDFRLLLPGNDDADDSAAWVPEKASALSAWCTGFCYALGVSGIKAFPDDSRELVKDFTTIAGADTSDDETDENALIELEEYVRVGVLLIHEELQPVSGRTEAVGPATLQ